MYIDNKINESNLLDTNKKREAAKAIIAVIAKYDLTCIETDNVINAIDSINNNVSCNNIFSKTLAEQFFGDFQR